MTKEELLVRIAGTDIINSLVNLSEDQEELLNIILELQNDIKHSYSFIESTMQEWKKKLPGDDIDGFNNIIFDHRFRLIQHKNELIDYWIKQYKKERKDE